MGEYGSFKGIHSEKEIFMALYTDKASHFKRKGRGSSLSGGSITEGDPDTKEKTLEKKDM